MVKIKKQLINDTPYKFGKNNGKKYITVHQTGNTSRGANAKMHAILQSNGNARGASWHWQVDDTEAIQSFTHNFSLYHAGDGAGNGGLNSIGVESCVNSDGNYKKAIENTAELVKKIMNDEGIPKSNVVQHNHWSGKNCPMQLRAGKDGITWNDFLKMIDGKKVEKADKPKTKPAKTSKWHDVGSKWTGQVLRLNDRGGAVKDLQRLVGVTADGMFGKDTQSAVKKAQKKAGIAVDGTPGPDTYKALTKKSKGANIKVDGKWGTDVTRGLQRVFGTPVDGKLSGQLKNSVTNALYSNTATFGGGGSVVVRAMQKKLGVTADGLLGPSSIRALQKRMGTPVDGKLSKVSPMVKELQRRLNKGTF